MAYLSQPESEILDLDEDDSETFQGFYRGRTGYKEWKQHILACLYHRRFRLAARILQHILQNLGVSQDIWLWRVIIIILSNLEATDDLFHKLYRVIYFGKTPDYDERRLCIFFMMLKLGKVEMGLEYLEKDMPKRMRSSVKEARDVDRREYERRYHAAMQMWRGIASFWKKKPDTDPSVYEFDEERFKHSDGKTPKKAQDVGIPGRSSPVMFDETMDEEDQHLEEAVRAKETAGDFLSASGYDIIHNFTADRVLDMFECFLDAFDFLDPYLRYFIQIADAGGGKYSERIEKTLLRYVAKNPQHPGALDMLIRFYKATKVGDLKSRRLPLEKLCQLVPYGHHVTCLAEDLLQEEEEFDTNVTCDLVMQALDYRSHWTDSICWTLMAATLRRLSETSYESPDDVTYVKELCGEILTYWDKFHFRFPERDQEEGKLLLGKIRVCWSLYGSEHMYVTTGKDMLSSKHKKKLSKSQDQLNQVFSVFGKDSDDDEIMSEAPSNASLDV